MCGNDLQTLLDFCGSPQIDAVERVKGIEPSYEAWEAAVLPLNYTRISGRAECRLSLRNLLGSRFGGAILSRFAGRPGV